MWLEQDHWIGSKTNSNAVLRKLNDGAKVEYGRQIWIHEITISGGRVQEVGEIRNARQRSFQIDIKNLAPLA